MIMAKSRNLRIVLGVLLFLGSITDVLGDGVMLDGLGGTSGYGDPVMARNDDGSSDLLNLPFVIDFYGTDFTQFYVNNNGNISFNGPLWEYTPDSFPVADRPMIAPYWGDVDTRGVGEVTVASPNPDTAVVTWNNVGYFPEQTDLQNDFQMVLRNRDDIATGDFDIEFRYDQLQWTTGDASGGSGGLGGFPAQAGFDAGDNKNFLSLPGSGTPDVLNLANTTNTSDGLDGLWRFAVRNGTPPGTTPDNPFMPVIVDDGWEFQFSVPDIDTPVWIDPLVAVGYDYFVDSGPYFSEVYLPNLGDNNYDLWQWDGVSWFDTTTILHGEEWYDFGVGGLNRFRILGIETGLGLDPLDPTAFVTGLKFANVGSVTMRQVPITFDTGPAVVPGPSSVLLCGIGLVLSSIRSQRRKSPKSL